MQGEGTQRLLGGFGAVVAQSLIGIREETDCLHTCAHGNSHVCVYAHSMCQSRERSNPLELLDCLSPCFIYLPLAMPRSGLNPAHFLRAIIPHDGGMSVLLGEATQVSGQCLHVYMCVPLHGHVCAPLCTCVQGSAGVQLTVHP